MISRYTRRTFVKDTKLVRDDILNFDTDNKYPFHTENIVQNCGILRSCIEIYGKFIYGKGFDVSIWKVPVNFEGLTVDKLFRYMIGQFGKHKGFAVWIGYNGLLEVNEIKTVPFDCCRLRRPDDEGNINKIAFKKNWLDTKEVIKWYDVYNTDKEIIASQIELAGGWDKWKGQIFYYGEGGELEYPVNRFHSVIEDCITEIQIKLGKNANAMTNFMASTIIEVPFTFEQVAKEQGISVDQARNDFHTQINEMQGFDNIGKMMTIENPTIDVNGQPKQIKFHKTEIQDYAATFQFTENSIQDNIRKNYIIPKIFLDPMNTGFSTEIMNDLYHYYNQITSLERQLFEEIAMELLPTFTSTTNFVLTPLTYR